MDMEKDQYKELFDRSANAISVVIDDKFVDCNAANLKMLGYSHKQELLNKHPSDLSPEKQPDGRLSYEKANELLEVAYKKGSLRFEWNLKKADGTIFPVEVLLTVIPNKSKKTLYAVWRDITGQVESHAEKEKLINQLHQAQKMEAIGTLSGGIAHDFNNILSGIFGYAQLAKNHINDPKTATAYVNEIINGATKAAELVQQILTFTRKSTQEKKPLRIYIVVKEAVKLLRASIPTTIDIMENIHSRAKVMADSGKIHQVVMNLCTNAYQAMRDTGGTLSVGLTEIKIKNRGSIPRLNVMPGNYIRLEVKDTGQGMTRETMSKIFEPYFTTKAANKGTGIGLAVVKGIVDEFKGYIEVDSRKGKGASFKVFFPIIQEKTGVETTKPERTILYQGSERILLVDDDKNILNTNRKLLEYHGYRVSSFLNVMAAFQEFEKDPLKFDLIVSDVTMPGMTGDVFSKKVLALRPGTPIILCSGFNENISEKKLQDIGVRKFLHKPIIKHELVSEIQHILSGTNESGRNNPLGYLPRVEDPIITN